MRITAAALFVVLTGLCPALAARSPQNAPELRDADASRRVDEYLQGEMEKQHIPGLAIGVYRNGEIVKVQGYGLASVKKTLPVTAETFFHSGSVGKQFTATAILMLVEEGKVGLEDSIAKYFPDVPEKWKAIKVRNLLSHTSGLQDYLDHTNLHKDYTPTQLLKAMKSFPMDFAPGDGWNYSNTNYALLGFIIENVTGTFYGDFLQERIFRPLGMNSGQVVSKSDGLPNRSEGYHSEKGKIEDQGWATPIFNTTADGSLYFNVVDLAKWDAALYTEKLLKASSLNQMWTIAKLNNGSLNRGSYGFGWGIRTVMDHSLIEHSGGWLGFKAHIARYVDDKLTVVLLANSDSTKPAQIAHVVAGIYEPVLAFNPIPDIEPNITTLARNAIQKLSSGKTPDGMDKDEVKPFQKYLRNSGPLSSLELVRREVNEMRHYTYRLRFTDATVFFQIDLATDYKIKGMHLWE